MMNGKVNVSSKDRTSDLRLALAKLKDVDVLVGIPQEKSSREDGGKATNAELLFIHTKGSPANHIPARPVIEPAIENDKEVISDILGQALKATLDGNEELMFQLLEKAGLEGQGVAQDWFDNPSNGWPPNSPRTKAAKIAKGSTDPKPLIDTGEMRKSITYVVRKEK